MLWLEDIRRKLRNIYKYMATLMQLCKVLLAISVKKLERQDHFQFFALLTFKTNLQQFHLVIYIILSLVAATSRYTGILMTMW